MSGKPEALTFYYHYVHEVMDKEDPKHLEKYKLLVKTNYLIDYSEYKPITMPVLIVNGDVTPEERAKHKGSFEKDQRDRFLARLLEQFKPDLSTYQAHTYGGKRKHRELDKKIYIHEQKLAFIETAIKEHNQALGSASKTALNPTNS